MVQLIGDVALAHTMLAPSLGRTFFRAVVHCFTSYAATSTGLPLQGDAPGPLTRQLGPPVTRPANAGSADVTVVPLTVMLVVAVEATDQ
jgi:hypothetical protein